LGGTVVVVVVGTTLVEVGSGIVVVELVVVEGAAIKDVPVTATEGSAVQTEKETRPRATPASRTMRNLEEVFTSL
jgi:hypothetical protein